MKKKPPEQQSPYERNEKPQRQYQVRGCGDPSCARCNPETAALQGNNGMRGTSDNMREMMELYERAKRMAREQRSPRYMGYDLVPDFSNEQPSRPNPKEQNLKKLREPIAKWLTTTNPDVSLDEIVGNETARRAIESVLLDQLDNASLYSHYGLRAPKGVMLYGPPGCGKTMFAKAAASLLAQRFKSGVEMINISASQIQTPYVGQTERHIMDIFAYARAYHDLHSRPIIIFVDEADAIFPDRTGRLRRVAPWEESQVATFLAEMDGLEKCGAFVMLATNRPEALDEALLRDGRCDRKIKVERPTQEAFSSIVERQLKMAPLFDNIEMLRATLVEEFFHPFKIMQSFQYNDRPVHFTLGHIVSGAMANSLVNRAKQFAFERDKAEGTITGITAADCRAAVEQVWEENKGLVHAFALKEFAEQTQVKLDEQTTEKTLN